MASQFTEPIDPVPIINSSLQGSFRNFEACMKTDRPAVASTGTIIKEYLKGHNFEIRPKNRIPAGILLALASARTAPMAWRFLRLTCLLVFAMVCGVVVCMTCVRCV